MMHLEMERDMSLIDESELSEDEQKAILLDRLESREKEALDAIAALENEQASLSKSDLSFPINEEFNEPMKINLQRLISEEE